MASVLSSTTIREDWPEAAIDCATSSTATGPGIARDLTDVIGDRDVGEREFGSSCGVDIEADDAPPAIDEIAGDCASHNAKPDDSDGLVHAFSPGYRIRLYGQRRPRLG
jgi:hypothetical protein